MSKSNILKNDNQQIQQGFLAEDWDIMQACYENVYGMITRMVEKNSGTEDDARTLILDSFKIFRKKCESPEFELIGKFSTYIYGVCRKLWLKKLRDRKKDALHHLAFLDKKSSSDDDDNDNSRDAFSTIAPVEDNTEEKINTSQLYELVLTIIRSLGIKCKQVILLYGAEKSHKEIASVMQISEGASRKRIHDCKGELAGTIKKSGYYEEMIEYPYIHKFLRKYIK